MTLDETLQEKAFISETSDVYTPIVIEPPYMSPIQIGMGLM